MKLLSNRIIGCALTVLHGLGTGFREKVYENALLHAFREVGLAVSQQHRTVVRYDGIMAGITRLTCSRLGQRIVLDQ